jgi:acetyltransferase-like isoleucine patch superfamily enzyme
LVTGLQAVEARKQKLIRSLAKRLADAIALILVLPAVGLYRVSAAIGTPEAVFPGYSQCFSLIPGLTGVYLRRAFYRCVLPRCGRDVCISFGSVFSHPTAELGDRVYIGIGCMIGDATLEDDVLIGSHVSIINGRRQHGIERLDIPVREQPGEYPRVTIGRDTWIGDRAVVTACIGEQAVVGTLSLVTKEFPDFCILQGIPAGPVGFRKGALITSGIRSVNEDLADRSHVPSNSLLTDIGSTNVRIT